MENRSAQIPWMLAGVLGLVLLSAVFIRPDSPLSRFFYDSFLRIRAGFIVTGYADPFLVVIDRTVDGNGGKIPDVENPSLYRAVRGLGYAGIEGLFMSSLIRPGSPDLEGLIPELEKIPSVVVGGLEMRGIGEDAPPVWQIRGDPPPDIPRSEGYWEPDSSLDTFLQGHLNVIPDADGIIRKLPLVYRTKSGYIPAAALVMLVKSLGMNIRDLSWESGRRLRLGPRYTVHVDRRGCVLLDFPLSWERAFIHYRLDTFIRLGEDLQAAGLLRRELKNSIVFIIDADAGAALGMSPLSNLFPSAGISPIFVNQIINGRKLRYLSFPGTAGIALLFTVMNLAILFAFPVSPMMKSLFVTLLFVLWMCLLMVLFVWDGLFIDPSAGVLWFAGATSTAVLRHERLRKRNEKLREIDLQREKIFIELGKNSASITHNIQSHAALAINFAGSLKFEPLTDFGRTNLDFLQKTLDELQRSLRSIVTLIKAKHSGIPQEVDVSLIARGIYHIYLEAAYRNVSVDWNVGESPLWVFATPMEVSQVIENILNNALEAYDDGPKKIRFSIRRDHDDAVIEIEDHGRGMETCETCAVGNCTECTEFRIGSSRKKNGSGLGLVYVKHTLAKYDARLSISSRTQDREKTDGRHGTSVIIKWPLMN